ncbi:hypothetical protein C8J57DRAFT_1532003 [Mycena rebaudengoi]|nr:hypothetical protein C8J57DRAFT_1532003 [Mycena rebaudengoi]
MVTPATVSASRGLRLPRRGAGAAGMPAAPRNDLYPTEWRSSRSHLRHARTPPLQHSIGTKAPALPPIKRARGVGGQRRRVSSVGWSPVFIGCSLVTLARRTHLISLASIITDFKIVLLARTSKEHD